MMKIDGEVSLEMVYKAYKYKVIEKNFRAIIHFSLLDMYQSCLLGCLCSFSQCVTSSRSATSAMNMSCG